jgi:hypothetical protein
MAKYYIKSNTFEVIFSTDKNAYNACRRVIHERLPTDTLDEYMYIDQRGYRDAHTADQITEVVSTVKICRKEGLIE